MDRRTVWAILLMMVIAVAPALFLKKPAEQRASGAVGQRGGDSVAAAAPDSVATVGAADTGPTPPAPAPTASADTLARDPAAPPSRRADTVLVTSPLYTYGISTVGARLVQAELSRYASMAPGHERERAEILPEDSELMALTVVRGRDTIDFSDVAFTPSAPRLAVSGSTPLQLSGEKDGVRLDLTYAFGPADYRILVSGRVSEIGPNGGALLVGMGPTMANTEVNLEENQRELATRHQAGRYRAHRPREPRARRAARAQRAVSSGPPSSPSTS